MKNYGFTEGSIDSHNRLKWHYWIILWENDGVLWRFLSQNPVTPNMFQQDFGLGKLFMVKSLTTDRLFFDIGLQHSLLPKITLWLRLSHGLLPMKITDFTLFNIYFFATNKRWTLIFPFFWKFLYLCQSGWFKCVSKKVKNQPFQASKSVLSWNRFFKICASYSVSTTLLR